MLSPETHHEPDDHRDPELPSSLRADLRARFGVTPEIPPAREAELLGRIQQVVERRRPAIRLVRWVTRVAALVAVTLLLWALPPRAANPPDPQIARYDVDGSGQVDILDAFRLALWLDQSDRDPRRTVLPHDLNDDGRVDQRDVDLIAQRAVALR